VADPPYSETASFLVKAELEYRREKNIILKVPSKFSREHIVGTYLTSYKISHNN
jgi:hypothetical protein